MQKHPRQRKWIISEGQVVFAALALVSSANNNNKGCAFGLNIFLPSEKLEFEGTPQGTFSVAVLKLLY